MSSRAADIERLNRAITSLDEDAEGMHELIARSASELENATAASNRAADNAAKIIEALEPMAKEMEARYRDSAEMLGEAKKASDEQRAATAEQMEAMKGAVTVSLEYVGTTTEATRDGLVKTVETTFGELGKAQEEAFDDIRTKTLKEHERTRDELQTDMLGFKNATSARLETLEAELTKAQGAIKELEGKVAESADAAGKRLLIPIYVAIGLGVVNLICLVLLLMR